MSATMTLSSSANLGPGDSTVRTESGTTSFPELVYAGNTGNSCGIATVGFQTAKKTPGEWQEANYAKYYQALDDVNSSEQLRMSTKSLIKEADQAAFENQKLSTKKLAERLHDINFWKTELEREINDVDTETKTLVSEKRRLENALIATEVPLHIATDNLNCRDRRYGGDKVEDEVETGLIVEVDIINKVQQLLKKTIDQANCQISRNRDAKQTLEMDWSDKVEADENDAIAARLKNTSTNKQFYHGVARYQENMSTPETWAQLSHEHVVTAERERMASMQLRALIESILVDTSRDMRTQADRVETALQKNLDRLLDAKLRLETELDKVCDEIARQEANIAELKAAIRAKEDYIKVVQTRLHQRNFRPNVELCKDPAQDQLVKEMEDLMKSLETMEAQLVVDENKLKDLGDTRITLEKEIELKKNTIFIDQKKVFPHRSRYPATTKLQGHLQS